MENRKNLFWSSRIILVTVIFIIICKVTMPIVNSLETTTESASTTSEAYIPSEPENQIIKLEPRKFPLQSTTNKEQILFLIKGCEKRIKNAEEMRTSAIALGYENNHPVVLLAGQERENATYNLKCYKYALEKIQQAEEEAQWNKKKQEYPIATEIWLFLKNYGYNDYVCAGILGNIMTEVGGQTLDINPELYDNSGYYYGICQWNQGAYSVIHGAKLKEQLDFLVETISFEINSSGYAYAQNFDIETFLNLTNEQEAALAFAQTYERCDSSSYGIRAYNATTAFNYFVNN